MTDFSVKKNRNGAKSIPPWSEWRDGAALCASPLLDDPNALHFGTRLRTKKLKNLPPAAFFTLFALSGFESLPIEKTDTDLAVGIGFLVGVAGLEPTASCSQSRRATSCATPRNGYIL